MPNIIYSVKERIEMVKYYEQGHSLRRVVDHFAAENPDRPIPSVTTVNAMIKSFYKTGNLNASIVKCSRPSRQLSEETKFNICLKAEEDPSKPFSQIAKELQISSSSVQKVLKLARLRKSKSKKNEDSNDPNPPIFSQNMIDRLKVDESCLRRACFANEATILFVSKSDRQNVLVCSWRIQHRIRSQSDVEYQKLHVWIGAVGNRRIGPFFIKGILDGNSYLKMLRDEIIPALKAIDTEDAPVFWYQRDGVPTYYTADVFAYLNEQFPGRWIGRNCRIKQRTCEFDMSLLDHALSGRLKNILYAGEQIGNLSILQTKIAEIISNMDPQRVCNSIRAFYDRDLREKGKARR